AQTNEITIGITIITTGPAAAPRIPQRNALGVGSKQIAGHPVKLTVVDDAGGPTPPPTKARRLVTEEKADILKGSSHTPATIAVSNVANEAGIPHFGLAPFPITAERAKWSVALPQPIPIMGKVLYEHMKAHNVKTVGYIGYSDSYGDLWFKDFNAQGVPMGMTMVRRRALCAAGYVCHRPGAETRCRQSRRNSGRRFRHGRGSAAGGIARSRLQGSDLSNPRCGQHGFYPHRGQVGRRRHHGIRACDGSRGSA